MDITQLEYAQLVALKADVERELKARESEEKAKAKRQIVELAKTYGLNIEDVLGKTQGVRKPVEAKYRNPDDASMTWTGRGRKPVWVQQHLDAGKTLEDLAV
ncbi:H-NS histone family protein [Neisseriaceae bacterium JH1-16]|nr:H-NS histone family protein [Neisseriaceae bacterium JH1-16]